MTLAVRFRYFEARTPSFDIVELSFEQWREFFLLERSHLRMEWMILAGSTGPGFSGDPGQGI